MAAFGRAEHLGGNDNAFGDEGGDHLVGRLAIKFARRSKLCHAAIVHDSDAVGQRHGFGLVVGNVDDRRAGTLVEGGELVLHRGAQMDVKIGQRFVEQHQRWCRDQAAGKRDPLALAAGQIGRPAVAETLEVDKRHGVVRPCACGSRHRPWRP
jgi:hypothetical protein